MKKVMARLILGADGKLAGIFVGVILGRGGDFLKCGIGIFVLEVVVIEELLATRMTQKALTAFAKIFNAYTVSVLFICPERLWKKLTMQTAAAENINAELID